MVLKPLLFLASALGSLAVTPPGFQPSAQTDLLVAFANASANSGNVLPRDATQSTPRIGTVAKLAGSSFAVIMVDLDIPTDTPPATSTLLHWLQVGLVQANSTTIFSTASGGASAYALAAPASQAAFQPYAGPNPPARIPLSHRYTQILVNTTGATNSSLSVLQQSAANRRGYDVLAVLTQAGLADKVIAGNYFNVTNPGPVNGTGTASPTGSGTVSPTTSPTGVRPGAAGVTEVSGMLLGISFLGAVFFGL